MNYTEAIEQLKARKSRGEFGAADRDAVEVVMEHAERLTEQVEQLQVQLAGCGVAALGWNKEPAKKGDYGWSASYQDVLKIRLLYEEYKEAINKVWEVASGECQVAMDDTQGMEWISDYLSSVCTEEAYADAAALAATAPQSADKGGE